MGVIEHSKTSRIHKVPDLIYANQGERLADTSLTSLDLYKFATQLSDFNVYMLTDVSPNVWKEIAITGLEGDTIYPIYSMSDFPTPVGDVITLQSGKYVIKNALSTAYRFEIPANNLVTWVMEDSRYNVFTYTGTGTLFSSTNFLSLTLEDINILLTGDGAQLFDLVSNKIDLSAGQFNFRTGQVIFTGNNTTVGNQVQGVFRLDDAFIQGFSDGIEINRSAFSYLTNNVFVGDGNSATFIKAIDIVGFLIVGAGNAFTLTVNENAFYLDPVIKTFVIISNTLPIGPGSFYKAGTTGSISSFADNSTSPTAVSVSDDSGDALFTSNSHGLNIGETVTHTTFTESSYNGTFVVTAATTDTYKVGLSYVSVDSGLFETTTTQVNSTAHGLSNGDSLSVFDTVNFDGGYSIFNVQVNSFEISLGKAFPGSESTGTWDTGSLTGCGCKRSKYVTTLNNGDESDSKNIGSAVVGGNTAETVITSTDVFYDLNLNSLMVEASNIELWKLTNKTTGEIRYEGLAQESLTFSGLIAPQSAGASERFDFRLLKNGSPLASPDNIDIPIDVNGNVRSTALLWPITVDPGDLFRLQVANRQGTSNIIIDTLKISIN